MMLFRNMVKKKRTKNMYLAIWPNFTIDLGIYYHRPTTMILNNNVNYNKIKCNNVSLTNHVDVDEDDDDHHNHHSNDMIFNSIITASVRQRHPFWGKNYIYPVNIDIDIYWTIKNELVFFYTKKFLLNLMLNSFLILSFTAWW